MRLQNEYHTTIDEEILAGRRMKSRDCPGYRALKKAVEQIENGKIRGWWTCTDGVLIMYNKTFWQKVFQKYNGKMITYRSYIDGSPVDMTKLTEDDLGKTVKFVRI